MAPHRSAQRASAPDIYNRNMVSYHKTTMFYRFGGIIWWKVLIATGIMNEGMVPPRAQVHLLPVAKVAKADVRTPQTGTRV